MRRNSVVIVLLEIQLEQPSLRTGILGLPASPPSARRCRRRRTLRALLSAVTCIEWWRLRERVRGSRGPALHAAWYYEKLGDRFGLNSRIAWRAHKQLLV